MGLRAILPGPHTSKRQKEHAVFPYLLRGLTVSHPNQVWGVDITYIPMISGFMYLFAIVDLYSRFLIHWSLSNSMDAQWCANTCNQAVEVWDMPQIVNTDQGSQFKSDEFVNSVISKEIKLSMDGKGRAIGNVFIERF
ncbi:MAG TPA: DDE-type integrase/transposase/recombinase [Saprospiraceae bacterium]|nr:DDE-type integrase/transposase/recombinase [Saprospiraceae bacterium]